MVAPVRTIFFGSGGFALPALQALSDAVEVAVVAVITAPPRKAGRRGELRATPVADAAAEAGIDVRTPARLRDDQAFAEIVALAPELVVLADYGRLVPELILDLPDHGALNLHPSLLPRHRGASPVAATILAGDTETGVTLMRMDAGLDTGPLIAQRRRALDGTEMAPDLQADLAADGAELLVESVGPWLAWSLAAKPQSDTGATLTRPLQKDDGRLEPEDGAAALERQVRAYQPWPGSFIPTVDGRLIVWRASIEDDGSAGAGMAAGSVEVGDIVPSGDGVALGTATGPLGLLEVQPAGRRRMSGADYRRGLRP